MDSLRKYYAKFDKYVAEYKIGRNRGQFAWSNIETVRSHVINTVGDKKGEFSCTIMEQWVKGWTVYTNDIGIMIRYKVGNRTEFQYIDIKTGKRWELQKNGKERCYIGMFPHHISKH